MNYFCIRTGAFYQNESLLFHAYSGGNLGTVPEAVNNPAFCHVKDTGPLPPGFYSVGAPQNHSKLGPCALPLTPDPGNAMYGRGDFFLHGDNSHDNRSASEGCIVHSPGADRQAIWDSGIHRLQVVAEDYQLPFRSVSPNPAPIAPDSPPATA